MPERTCSTSIAPLVDAQNFSSCVLICCFPWFHNRLNVGGISFGAVACSNWYSPADVAQRLMKYAGVERKARHSPFWTRTHFSCQTLLPCRLLVNCAVLASFPQPTLFYLSFPTLLCTLSRRRKCAWRIVARYFSPTPFSAVFSTSAAHIATHMLL